jgi:catechol 2,3-dioxygenase-like lactoylglutathione lyase family enzyme
MHIAVENLERNIAFYTAAFGAEPSIIKPDYAKWQLEDPRINFAISTRGRRPGLDHVGIQADSAQELDAIEARLEAAGIKGLGQKGTTCCYAESDKYWTVDPQGIAWESFHSLGSAPVFGQSVEEAQGAACCTPDLTRCCG